MRISSLVVRSAAFAMAVVLLAPLSTLAQTFAAGAGTDPVIVTTAPSNSTMKASAPHHAEDSLLYGRVRDGVYTVDGMVAKVQLNYDVNGVRHLYLFVPGLGTAVVSAQADPDAITSQASLQENTLTFAAGEHTYSLTGVALATGKGGAPQHLFVRLDRAAWKLNRHPMIGFGNADQMPYQWPGALASANAPAQPEQSEIVPPVPPSLLPSTRTTVPVAAANATPASPSAPVSALP